MPDFRLIRFSDLAPISKVSAGPVPGSLYVVGGPFIQVDEVYVNDSGALFVVDAPDRLVVDIPPSERTAPIRSVVAVTSSRGLTTNTTAVDFSVLSKGGPVSGFPYLMQSFLKVLLTRPGESLLSPSLGTGLPGIAGSSAPDGVLTSRAANAIRAAERQVIAAQSKNNKLQPSEKLDSAGLLSASFSRATSSLRLRVRITAVDGSTGAPEIG